MTKSKKPVYCSLDIEGTGLDPKKDNIIEVGAVLFEIDSQGGLILGKEFTQLVKPAIPIPEFIQNLTGIREKDVADAPAWEDVLPKFKKFVGRHVILGQNIQFDLSFLAAAGLKFEQDFMDTKQLAGMFLPQAKFFNLEYLMRFVGEPLVSHHRALDDAKTTAKLLQKIIQSFHSLPFKLQTQVADLLAGSQAVYKELFAASKIIADSPAAAAAAAAVSGQPYQGTLFESGKKSAASLPEKLSKCLSKVAALDAAFVDVGLVAPGSDLAALIADQVAHAPGGAVFACESLENELSEPSGDWLVVEDPQNSICEVRLTELLTRGRPSILLAEFLVKVLVWKEVTGGHSIRNLSLFGDDYNFRDLVCADFGACSQHGPRSSCHVGKTISEWGPRSKVLTTYAALLAYCRAAPNQKFASAYFWDVASLEQAMEKNSAWTLNQKRLRFLCGALYNPADDSGLLPALPAQTKKEIGQLLSDIDLNFGIWSIELKKYADGPTQYLCDAHLRDSEEYGKIVSSAKHLVGRLQSLTRDLSPAELSGPASFVLAQIRQSADLMQEFLLEPRPDCVYWFDIFTSALKLKRQARAEDLKTFADFGQVVFFGALASPEVRDYFLRVFRLPHAEAIECRLPSPPVRLCVNTDLPTKDTPYAYQAMITTLGKILSQLPGRTVALVNSQKNLDNIYEPVSRLNLKSRLLVQRYTGHFWKNLETYGQEERVVWFLTVKNFLSNAQKLPPTTNLIILRIPYDAPGVMSGLFDPDSVFAEYILPRTAIRLQQILRRVAPEASPGSARPGGISPRVIFLDPRMLEEYNATLLGAVEAELDCERIEFDSAGWQIAAED